MALVEVKKKRVLATLLNNNDMWANCSDQEKSSLLNEVDKCLQN